MKKTKDWLEGVLADGFARIEGKDEKVVAILTDEPTKDYLQDILRRKKILNKKMHNLKKIWGAEFVTIKGLDFRTHVMLIGCGGTTSKVNVTAPLWEDE